MNPEMIALPVLYSTHDRFIIYARYGVIMKKSLTTRGADFSGILAIAAAAEHGSWDIFQDAYESAFRPELADDPVKSDMTPWIGNFAFITPGNASDITMIQYGSNVKHNWILHLKKLATFHPTNFHELICYSIGECLLRSRRGMYGSA